MSLRRARWLPWVVAVCAMALFARLGVWQYEKAGEKRAMLADAARALNDRRPQPPTVLTDRDRVGAYDWVVLRGRFADAPAVLLDNQQRAGRVGVRAYRVFLSNVDANGEGLPVLVDLGWLPLPPDRTLPEVPRDARRTTLTGLLMPPPGRGLDLGPPVAQAGGPWLATAIDPVALRDTLGLRDLAPRVLRPPPETGFGFERDFDILPNTLPPERHIGYAVQWFGLAATVLIVALLLERRRRAGLRATTLAGPPPSAGDGRNTDTMDA